MLQEEKTDILLKALYGKDSLNSYDFCAEEWKTDEEGLLHCKAIADELVDAKLAKYNDAHKTELAITNFGRYWELKGGFLVYLKENDKKIKPEHCKEKNYDDERNSHLEELNEELKEARLKFTHYRIVTYWWSFALTIISFVLSLLSLYLVLRKN
jgi:hypothetical protein